ncbi:nucleic acid-binding protein [Trichoderma citrinoviride]|uniref:Nucleic acid-binding protein n=1 Tax=Trichoderma citrinoviride TaxID=58853 RepID=A0A2T4B4U2_9HYPO|nr:nucleic acid-binding protein [Trichoderma citrinoviride]PTB64342.1 nucleic acid-binding protein [Trichoderma citrinoviride]
MSSFLLRRSVAASAGAARAFSTSSPRSVARITIIGNLADTPEAQTASSSDKEFVRYSVASNSGSKDNRQTSWFRVTSFVDGPRKDFMLSLPKGTLVYVEGDASINSYTDSNNQVRHGLNIVQRSIEVLKRPALPEQGE